MMNRYLCASPGPTRRQEPVLRLMPTVRRGPESCQSPWSSSCHPVVTVGVAASSHLVDVEQLGHVLESCVCVACGMEDTK